jgi:catechol 2,3-dioxygenase-like lactoylglutathione lyase family enzyme
MDEQKKIDLSPIPKMDEQEKNRSVPNSGAPGWDAQVTFCYTADFEATTHFYEVLLGLPLALDQGACRIYRVRAGAFIGVCRRARTPDSDGIILTLVTDDVDGWHARLVERGVQFEKAPNFNAKFKIYHCFLRDPNGYLIEIQRFDDPAWKALGDG